MSSYVRYEEPWASASVRNFTWTLAFGYVNFVERVGEGGIETIGNPDSRYVKAKFDETISLQSS